MKRPTPKKKKVSVKSKDIRKIVIIFVVAFVALSLFLIFGRENAGQAIRYEGAKVGEGGIFASGEVEIGKKVSVPLIVNIGKAESYAFSLKVAFDPRIFREVFACNLGSFNLGSLNDKFIFENENLLLNSKCSVDTPIAIEKECKPLGFSGSCSIISIEAVWLPHPTIKNSLTGEETLADLTFISRTSGKGLFVPRVEVLGLNNNPLKLIMQDSTLTVFSPEEPECTEDADCAEGEICVDAICMAETEEEEEVAEEPGCIDELDCAENEQCADSVCVAVVEEPAVCDSDVDCEEDELCEEGTCVAAPTDLLNFAVELQSLECDTNADCNGWLCADSTCIKETPECGGKVKYCEFVWTEGAIDKTFKLAKGDKYLLGSKFIEVVDILPEGDNDKCKIRFVPVNALDSSESGNLFTDEFTLRERSFFIEESQSKVIFNLTSISCQACVEPYDTVYYPYGWFGELLINYSNSVLLGYDYSGSHITISTGKLYDDCTTGSNNTLKRKICTATGYANVTVTCPPSYTCKDDVCVRCDEETDLVKTASLNVVNGEDRFVNENRSIDNSTYIYFSNNTRIKASEYCNSGTTSSSPKCTRGKVLYEEVECEGKCYPTENSLFGTCFSRGCQERDNLFGKNIPSVIGLFQSDSGETIVSYGLNSCYNETVVLDYFCPVSDFFRTTLSECSAGTVCNGGLCVDPASLIASAAVEPETELPFEDQPSDTGGYYSDDCEPEISCSAWSYCNSTLKQEQTCIDQNHCVADYIETQNCSSCQESWICSEWSACSNNQQYRTCVDEHYCDSELNGPALQKSCTQAVAPGPQPAQVTPRITPPVTAPVTTEPRTTTPQPSFWEKNKTLILVGIVLILVVAIALGVMYIIRNRAPPSNIDELVNWIGRERSGGKSDDEIRQVLSLSTDWKQKDIDKAFKKI